MKFDFHYLSSAKYTQWVGLALIILFSLLIIIECTALKFSPVSVPVTPIQDKNLVTNKKKSFKSLLNSTLFGVYVPNDLNASSVKKSMLDVTLVGILFADNMDESQVIIRSADGEEKTYNIGDKIPGNAVIKRIMAGGVLVERDGNLESLSLTKIDLIFKPVAKPLQEE